MASERKNIKRNKARVSKETFLRYGRKGHTHMNLAFEDPYLKKLVKMGLL